MLSDMNGLFKSGQAGGERLTAMDSSVALSQLETLDRAAWRTRFRDPSELKRAADELAACGGPIESRSGVRRASLCVAQFGTVRSVSSHGAPRARHRNFRAS
jgi:hypothetical protein